MLPRVWRFSILQKLFVRKISEAIIAIPKKSATNVAFSPSKCIQLANRY